MSDVVSNGVPPGWVLATIADIVDGDVVQAPPLGDGEFTYVDISSVDNRTKRVIEPKRLRTAEAPSRARQVLRSGDVLISMTRPNLNAVAHVDDGLAGSIGSTGFHVLRSTLVEPKWLFCLVQTGQFVEQMTRLTQGALYPAVRPKDINQFSAWVPPVAEQRRIVAEIEKQFSRLDAGVAALKRVASNLRRYKAAVLKAACDGSLSALWRAAHADVEPAEKLLARILRERRRRWEEAELAKLVAKGKPPKDDRWKQRYKEPAAPRTAGLAELPSTWCWATVEQLMWDGQYGTSIKCDHDASGVPVLRIPNIVNEQVDLADLKFATGAVQGWPGCKLVPGDILVCRTNGSIDLLGKSAVISAGFEGDYAFASYLIRLRLVWSDPIARYVHLVFGSRWGRRLIEGNAASSAGQHNLSLSKIARFPVPLPPIDEMQHIVGSVDECLSTASATAQAVAVNLKRVDRLRQSILKAAFEGRLVAQDPSDEPAAALLERIRADRDAGERRTARRTRPRRRVPHG